MAFPTSATASPFRTYAPSAGNTSFFPNALVSIGAVQPPSFANGYVTSHATNEPMPESFSLLSLNGDGDGNGDANAAAEPESNAVTEPANATLAMAPAFTPTANGSKSPMIVRSADLTSSLTVSSGGPVGTPLHGSRSGPTTPARTS
jgi:hypothetical protein